ncbi:GNAT family N-acetyltransferase [Salinicola endophyticus]|uniref:GNAT family N-acetyltransferase n=1 Tax=Salinicola endophyticus TaxID=1949083 RepID=A0ABY8FMA7_9GAMM|nr:GNAT family N-acetyltransferase [Salinicola endophyticus]WFF43170.1 GNAT family N-acetyltransferase [Salinicola endophyticus]
MAEIKAIANLQRRVANETDGPWLRQLFAQLRGLLPDLQANCPELLEQQWQLQRRVFANHYPDARTEVVLIDAQPVGSLTWHEGAISIRLLDIGLEARYRRQGLGERLLKELIDYADLQGKALELAVMRHNPALRLYLRLGFYVQSGGQDDVQLQMRCEPQRSR